ncbi:N-acetyltransferase [Desulfosporosinus fructosivorans]|uniref:N-acetyltransferase n=1 Tax=Desulfosporosinus fructosivorans TaxID=2018669 RepID=A0A4Z0QX91_9FIRM|nr:GNAT family protein [Desulfosporosinus fructosivorans]TGE35402.1 N-acetyltransferase [Desulfosporosinus fructosivorans]
MHNPFLVANRIYMRRLEKEDLEGNYFQWLNDQTITKWMRHGAFPNSPESMNAFYENLSGSKTDIVLAIVLKEQDRHIGNIGLHSINYVFRSAEIGLIIGETDCWGKGYAAEAFSAIADYSFKKLNLNRIAAGVVDENIGSIRALEKTGYKKEGILRQAYFCDGQYHDCVNLSLLHSDWLAGRAHESI